MKIKKLSVIVPIFNEERTLPAVWGKLQKLKVAGVALEIIWVDDGSGDSSSGWLKKQARRGQGGNKFVFKRKNEGKGAAIKSGLEMATGEYMIIQDADEEYDPLEIEKLVRKAERENLLVVFGSRDREIKNEYLYPHFYWGSKILCGLMNLAFGEKFTDPETCYKLVQTDLLRFVDISEKRFGMEIEVAAKIARLKVPFAEESITYRPRSFALGKKISFKDGVRAVYLIGKFWANDLHYGIVDRFLRRVRFEAALKYLKFGPGDVVVDAGCGRQARLGWKLRTKVKQYTGVDREVNDGRIANLKLVRADLERPVTKLKIKADKVVGAAILEHLEHPEVFMGECRRWLKKGGELALTTPAPPWSDLILKFLVTAKLILADEVFDHVKYWKLSELKGWMEENGWVVEKSEKFLWGLNNLIVVRKI